MLKNNLHFPINTSQSPEILSIFKFRLKDIKKKKVLEHQNHFPVGDRMAASLLNYTEKLY